MTNRLRSIAIINHPGTPVENDSSVSLNLADDDRGFLPNRLSTDQRDAIEEPAEGLTIYNTDTQTHELFDGSAWQQLAKSGGGPTPYLQIANNLSDVADKSTSRYNLGLGSAATKATTDFLEMVSNIITIPGTATVSITVQNAPDNTNAYDITIVGPSAQGSGTGSTITLNAGTCFGATGSGGALHFNAGRSFSDDGNGGDITFQTGQKSGNGIDGHYFLINLPTNNPHIVGALWNNSGVLSVSAG